MNFFPFDSLNVFSQIFVHKMQTLFLHHEGNIKAYLTLSVGTRYGDSEYTLMTKSTLCIMKGLLCSRNYFKNNANNKLF